MSELHTKCRITHCLIERLQADLTYYLDKIEQEHSSGWSPDAWQMICMANDARELDRLSIRLLELRKRMIRKAEAA